jgi:TonB-dependent receptor
MALKHLGWRAGLFALSLASSEAIANVNHDNVPQYLHIQEVTLDKALQHVAERFAYAYVANPKLLSHSDTVSLNGNYGLHEALAYLLKATPLTYIINDQGIVIKAKPAVEATAIEEVRVKGIRGSLNLSRKGKRESKAISDVIAAQDIAAYPDRNLAESLQRISGMSITREAGEGRQIILRGLNPDFTLVTLNGMPVLANNDSPMDSRTQRDRDRSFDLNLFTSDLFNQIQVLKSYSPTLPSGGMAGVAALSTARPFATPGVHATFTQQVGANQYANGVSSRSSAVVSATKGNWGGLFSISYGARNSQEQGANTFRWRQIPPDGADISLLDDDIAAAWEAQTLWIPRGNRYSVWRSDMRRLGAGAALEYKDTQSHITLDWIYGKLASTRQENHLYPRGFNSTPIIEDKTLVTALEVNEQNELVFGKFENARVGTENRYQQVATRFEQWVVNSENALSNTWRGLGVFGVQQASYDMPTSIRAYMRGESDVTLDYTQDYYFADIRYADDLTQGGFWQMNELDAEQYGSSSHFVYGKYTLEYQPSSHSVWQMGMDRVHFESKTNYLDIQDMLKEEWKTTAVEVPLNASYGFSAHPKLSWLALRPRAAFEAFDVSTSAQALTSSFEIDRQEDNTVKEIRTSAFVQHQWQSNRWTFLAGIRSELDETHVQVVQDDIKRSYTMNNFIWLPHVAANLRLHESVYRLSVSQSVGYPQLDTLTSQVVYNPLTQMLYSPNENLSPFTAYNIDLSVERYLAGVNRVSTNVFAKLIDDIVVSQRAALNIDSLSAYEQFIIADIDPDTIRGKVTPQNAEEAFIYGIEGTLQWEMPVAEVLPLASPYHLGLVINASYTQGDVRYYNENTGEALERKALPYLSPWLANVTGYIEGYALSLRVSATYRDSYIARVDSNTLTDEDETGFEPSLYLDAVFAYQMDDHWEWRIEATNLTNEREIQYSNSNHRPYNTTVSGRNYTLSLSYRL